MKAEHLTGVPARGGMRLGAVLRDSGVVSEAALAASLSAQKESGARVGEILTARGGAPPEAVAAALARQNGLDFVALDDETLIARAAELVAAEQAPTYLEQGLLPIGREHGKLVLAASDPHAAVRAAQELGGEDGFILKLAEPRALRRALIAAMPAALAARAAERRLADSSVRPGAATWQKATLALSLTALTLAAFDDPERPLRFLFIAAALVIACNGLLWLTSLTVSLTSSRPPPSRAVKTPGAPPRRRVSILIALYKEAETAPLLIQSLSALDYPPELLDVKIIVEADDDETPAAIAAQSPPAFIEVLRAPDGAPRTKPRALNFGLDFVRGDLVGVYDAEDRPPPSQIREIVAQFDAAPDDLACVQARLGYYNRSDNWLSRCFEIEYASWFDVMLPGLHRLGFPIPLGGTSLFVRRDVLEALGGWDSHNVTEDADLGMMIARAGLRTAVAPSLTEEEAACHLMPWIKQRSRWLKGYLVTWLTHMRRPRALVRDLGWRRTIALNVLLLSGFMGYLVLLPVLWLISIIWRLTDGAGWAAPETVAALDFLNIVIWTTLPILALAALRALQLRNWMRAAGWIITLPAYWPLGSLAAWIAIWEFFARRSMWRKTTHGVSRVAQALNQSARDALQEPPPPSISPSRGSSAANPVHVAALLDPGSALNKGDGRRKRAAKA